MKLFTAKPIQVATVEKYHLPVLGKLKVKPRKLRKFNAARKLHYNRYLKDPNLKKYYLDSVKIRYEGKNRNGYLKWDKLREALLTSAKDIIPKSMNEEEKNEWFIDEILDLMQRRQKTIL